MIKKIEKYKQLMEDEEICRQEIAMCCAEIMRCDNKGMLLRRAIRLKSFNVSLNGHQKHLLSDPNTPTSYSNKSFLLRRRLEDLKTERGHLQQELHSLGEWIEENKNALSLFFGNGLNSEEEPTRSDFANAIMHWSKLPNKNYGHNLRKHIKKNISIDGFSIETKEGSINNDIILFLENKDVRIYASPFWEIENRSEERTVLNTFQMDIYDKNSQNYYTTQLPIKWTYNIEKDAQQWELVVSSAISILSKMEVDPISGE